jgi:hypothetical protein
MLGCTVALARPERFKPRQIAINSSSDFQRRVALSGAPDTRRITDFATDLLNGLDTALVGASISTTEYHFWGRHDRCVGCRNTYSR